MTFVLKILGANSAAPAHNRNQSSQLLNIQNQYFLIDCGEGTQHQLRRFKVRISKINHIFISHLHGDHYLGLMGLILTMHLQGRVNDLFIFGPSGLSEIITIQLKHSKTVLNFRIVFTGIDPSANILIFETIALNVHTISLSHRIGCTGFLFREKPKLRRINKLRMPENISLMQIVALKNGEDLYDGLGKIIYKNGDLTLAPKKSRSYAYCSDTIYDESIIGFLKNVDLLYHESTFLHEQVMRARETFHTTALQAGIIAKKAQVGQLILGHYSIRYKDLLPLLEEARQEFTNTILAIEGNDVVLEE
ncbi:MAG: ribonuclease Z [Bacteroidota bacterium]|nr:ribonuclease Z [Bacteroidota bacterium]